MAMIKTFTSGTMLTLTILFYSDTLHAASLGPYRYDPSAFKESAYGYPDPNMIKALEFIENLRQNNEDESMPNYEARGAFRPFQEPLFKKLEGNDRENQQLENIRESSDEGRAEWAKLLLQALMQAESESRANGKPYRSGARYYNQQEDAMEDGGNEQVYDDGELLAHDKNDRLSRKHHVAFPPEGGYDVNPYKRTNEIIEEQYTPQSLATLESAFRELGKYTAPRKEQGRLEEEHFRKDEEDDISRANDFAYEDVADGEDWNSIEMKNRHRHKEIQFQDEETNTDREREGAGYSIKKALAGVDEADLEHLDSREKAAREKDSGGEMADAAMDLMLQYYKRLQDRMYERQPERGAGNAGEDSNVESEKVARGSEDEIEPGLLNQLVELSGRLQIPPDDILKMLKDAEQKKQAPGPSPAEIDADFPDSLQESSEMDTRRESKRLRDGYNRDLFAPNNADEDLTTEDILNILGTDRMYEKPEYFRKADQSKNRPPALYAPFQSFQGHRNHDSLRNGEGMDQGTDDRAISIDDDELARYLERLLVKNPDLLNAAAIPRARMDSSADEQVEADTYQDPVKELLRGISPREAAEVMSIINSLSSFAGNGYHAPRTQQKGEDFAIMMLKLKEFLNQQNGDRDRAVKESNREILGSEQY
ncbi:secretogranin-2 [Pristis pectinata]|uniref:secretogranin-2 n=1 Tax=Pristis pectinata TaxID=685728 RepID=UPI00223C90E2|nr:secretogranin-2 [Pristis pectinata]